MARTGPPEARYAAFVSYSHAEEEVAGWLHRRLERYRIPKALGLSRRRIGKVFRDRVELATSSDLGADIRSALERSDALIVLCSPRAARSVYVEQEIATFKAAGKGRRIFALIVDGEPHAAGKRRSADEECFPRALLHRVGADGRISDELEEKEPIAADIRPGKDGREGAALKIVAGLLGVGLDDLVRREKQAERRRLAFASGIATAMTVLAAGAFAAGALALRAQGEAERQAAEAMHRSSDVLARESKAIAETGVQHTALLMALQADPAAQRNRIAAKLNGAEGYPAARGRLLGAYGDMRLARAIGSEQAVALSPDGSRILARIGARHNMALISDTATGEPLAVLEGHAGSLYDAVLSPDGRRVITKAEDRSARLWDAGSGAPIAWLGDEESTAGTFAFTAAFSPDGARFVTPFGHAREHRGSSARIWASATGEAVAGLDGHTDEIRDAAYSPDGAIIVTASRDGTARLWDAGAGALLRVLEGHSGPVLAAAFSTDGGKVVTASSDRTARVWDAETGTELFRLEGHTQGVLAAIFSPDGKSVLTASEDGTARIFQLDAEPAERARFGHQGPVFAAAFSPDGGRIATASEDGSIRLWSVAKSGLTETWSPIATFRYEATAPRPAENWAFRPWRSLAFTPDGARVIALDDAGNARLWDVEIEDSPFTIDTGAEELASRRDAVVEDFRAPETRELDWPSSVAFSPDGARLVTAHANGVARIWDAESGNLLVTLEGHLDMVRSAAFSPDGRTVLTAALDGSAKLWDAATGAEQATLGEARRRAGVDGMSSALVGASYVAGAAFSPDGARVVTFTGGPAQIWDAATGGALATLQDPSVLQAASTRAAAFSPDGRRVVTVDEDAARVWDAATGTLVVTLMGHTAEVYDAAFSPDGARLVTASKDRTARLWSAETGEPLAVLAGHEGEVHRAAFTPDGARVVTSSADGRTRLWDARNGAPRAELSGYVISPTALSSDGSRLVTLYTDATVRISDVATGTALATLGWGGGSRIIDATFSPDGARLVAASEDGAARIWTLPQIQLAPPGEQVRAACEKLWRASAPLAFAKEDAQRYPALQGEPEDPATGDFVSPCKGVLAESAFATPPYQDEVRGLDEQAWEALVAKRYGDAEALARRARALDPLQLRGAAVLAHALMFQDKVEEAGDLYVGRRALTGSVAWEDMVAGDLVALFAAGHRHPYMTDVLSWLDLELETARDLGERAGQALFSRDYARAEALARWGRDLDPTRLQNAASLAHALMLQDRIEEADEIYFALEGPPEEDIEASSRRSDWRNAIARDFGELRGAEIDHPHMTAVLVRLEASAAGAADKARDALGAQDYAVAEMFARKGLELDPTHLTNAVYLARALMFQDRLQEADAIYSGHKGMTLLGLDDDLWDRLAAGLGPVVGGDAPTAASMESRLRTYQAALMLDLGRAHPFGSRPLWDNLVAADLAHAIADGRDHPHMATVLSQLGATGEAAARLGESAMDALHSGDFGRAERLARRSLELSHGQLRSAAYLAHALMFQGRLEEADDAYLAHSGRAIEDTPWTDTIRDDFEELREHGLDHPHMAEVLMQLESPTAKDE